MSEKQQRKKAAELVQGRASETPGLSSSGLLDSSMGSAAMQEQMVAVQEQLAAESTPSLLEQLAAAPPTGSTPSMDGMFQPIKNPAPVMPADAWELNKMESGVMYGGSMVSPTAVDAWQRVIRGMIGGNEEVQKRMEENDAMVHIIGRDNLLTDDFPDMAGGVTRDGRPWEQVRGVGAIPRGNRKVAAVGEETLIDLDRGREDGISPPVHEFAHLVHLEGLSERQKAKIKRLHKHHERSKKEEFVSDYGGSDPYEYFATATDAYLDGSGTEHNGAGWLEENDPKMHRLLQKVYGTPDEVRERAESVEVRTADTVEDPSP